LYQGRFKSFPIEADEHFYHVVRYVERNALRADLVRRAEAWRWCSLWRRVSGGEKAQALLAPWPLPVPANWREHVQQAQSEEELKALRQALVRGRPYGTEAWQKRTARRLGLEFTMRPRGRPKKEAAGKRKV
jgi:REP-associated tyrosine transposase